MTVLAVSPPSVASSGAGWLVRAATFLGVAAASAGLTVVVLSQFDPERPLPSARPIGIVQQLPAESRPVPPRHVAVDSAAEGFRVDPALEQKLQVGWIDGARATEDGAVLQVSGWAGDPALGVRMAHVGIGACGTIVAVVPVEQARPDVAATAHPNLDKSGWTARIFAAHLPDCEGRTLDAYAMPSLGRFLAKLAAAPAALPPLDPAGAQAEGPARAVYPEAPQNVELRRVRVAIAAQILRRCGEAACAEVSRLPRGEHVLSVVDRRAGWALVAEVAGSRAGWVPESDLDLSPQRLAQR